MIKLVVTDVDGTIVAKDEVLHDEMIAAIEKLKSNGIGYTIATGRVSGLVKDYVQRMQLTIPFIACNGGTIVDDKNVIMRMTIPLPPLCSIIDKALEMGMSLLYSIDGLEYAYQETKYVAEQQQRFGRYTAIREITSDQWDTVRLDKLIVMARFRDGSLDVIEDLCQQLPAEIGYKRYANKAIDILHRQATKENGIVELAKLLNIKTDEIMAIGDDLNDIEMLRVAGIGVAVNNAQQATKEVADYVATQDCYKGTIEAIEKFCFEEGSYHGTFTNATTDR